MRLFQNNFRGYMTSSHKENELHSSYIPILYCQSSVSVRSRRLCATCASAVDSSLSWTRSFLTSTSVVTLLTHVLGDQVADETTGDHLRVEDVGNGFPDGQEDQETAEDEEHEN